MTLFNKLYKYIKCAQPGEHESVPQLDVLESILKGDIKFTPIRDLNDPSELTPVLDATAVRESLSEWCEYGYSEKDMIQLRRQGKIIRLLTKPPYVPVPKSREEATALIRERASDNVQWLEQALEKLASEISSNVGVFCLSRRYDSLAMWAHYASNAEGLVLEFHNLHRVFTEEGDETGVLRRPLEVRYDRERVGITFDPESDKALFFSKFNDWSYEQEVRIVLPLAACIPKSKNNKTLFLYNINPSSIKRIILGWNMPQETSQKIHKFVNESELGISVTQARIERGRVKID